MTLSTKQDAGFASRKFIITMGGMVLTTILALYGKMDANAALVLGAAIGAYNWANLREGQGGTPK